LYYVLNISFRYHSKVFCIKYTDLADGVLSTEALNSPKHVRNIGSVNSCLSCFLQSFGGWCWLHSWLLTWRDNRAPFSEKMQGRYNKTMYLSIQSIYLNFKTFTTSDKIN